MTGSSRFPEFLGSDSNPTHTHLQVLSFRHCDLTVAFPEHPVPRPGSQPLNHCHDEDRGRGGRKVEASTHLINHSRNRCDALVEALRPNHSISEVYLDHTHIDPHTVVQLALEGLATHRWTVLTLNSTHVGDEGAAALGSALADHPSLRTLRLDDTQIATKGAICIGEALKRNRSLQELTLANNNAGPDGLATIGNALRQNSSLAALNLSNNRGVLFNKSDRSHRFEGLDAITTVLPRGQEQISHI